jgi:hypothetical protein
MSCTDDRLALRLRPAIRFNCEYGKGGKMAYELTLAVAE